MFLIHKMDTSLSRGIEYIPMAKEGDGKVGMLLIPSGDHYASPSATSLPTHLAVGKANEAALIPAVRLDSQIELEVITEADLTDTALGTKLQINQDTGDTVTADPDGHASLTYKEKLSDGTWLCRVRFI